MVKGSAIQRLELLKLRLYSKSCRYLVFKSCDNALHAAFFLPQNSVHFGKTRYIVFKLMSKLYSGEAADRNPKRGPDNHLPGPL